MARLWGELTVHQLAAISLFSRKRLMISSSRIGKTLVLSWSLLALVSTGNAEAANNGQPAPGKIADASTSKTLPASGNPELQQLLADPVAGRPEFQFLRERRQWLARQGGKPGTFQKVAGEFVERGAYYPAVELLWFAEKLSLSDEQREALKERMKQVLVQTGRLEAEADLAVQLWGGGRRSEAIAKLQDLARQHPYCEKAHYQLAYLTYKDYQEREEKNKGLLPLAERRKIFRLCYEEFLLTLAIDPLYKEAWDQLNMLRALLPEDRPFLVATNPITQHALDFMNEVLPPMTLLDKGDRSVETLTKAGEGFETVGLHEYAVYAWQAALSQSEEEGKGAKELRARIEQARKALPPREAAK